MQDPDYAKDVRYGYAHNHGPHDGDGIDCPEVSLGNGSFEGMCLRRAREQKRNRELFRRALKTSLADSEFLLKEKKEQDEFAKMRAEFWSVAQNEPTDFVAAAKSYARYAIEGAQTRPTEPYEVYVVWFAKTLQNWKAVVCSTLSDGMLYEITHNGDKRETYIDAYHKQSNIIIPD